MSAYRSTASTRKVRHGLICGIATAVIVGGLTALPTNPAAGYIDPSPSSAKEASEATSSAGLEATPHLSKRATQIEQRWEQLKADASGAIAAQRSLPKASESGFAARSGGQTVSAAATAETDFKPGFGDFTATPLAPSSMWQSGNTSGGFSWSYPIALPPTPGSFSPKVEINYNSGSVDGRTSTSNNQTSVLGEGFDVTASYIERTFVACKDDGREDEDEQFDRCWRGERLHLVLNGASSELVRFADNVYKPKRDDGTRVQRLTEEGINDDNNGEYWQVQTPDGSKLNFGMNRLPGATSSSPVTNSVLTVPVYSDGPEGDREGECADDWCHQAWRWNLDLAWDVHNNAITYWYEKEQNYYKRGGVDGQNIKYDRASYLKRIDYGVKFYPIYSGESTVDAPQRVRFEYDERCLAGATNCSELKKSTSHYWPDVPFDDICETAPASCDDNLAPTFFTRKRLTRIVTSILQSTGGTYSEVDSYALSHAWVDPGDNEIVTDQVLWLMSIQRTASASVPAIAVNPVRFITYDEGMSNRVDTTNDGIAPLIRPRLGAIVSETGATTDITYAAVDCSASDLPSPASNSRRCFPVYWAPNGGEPERDWFHKYVVESVLTLGGVTGESVMTRYEYQGPGWRYDQDPFLPNRERTWSKWQGFRKVTTRVGSAIDDERTRKVDIYFRGMDGNRNADGDAEPANVNGIYAPDVPDLEQYAGVLRESVVYNGDSAGAHPVSNVIYTPWSGDGSTQAANATATQIFPASPMDGHPVGAVTTYAFRFHMGQTQERELVTRGSTQTWRSRNTRVQEYGPHGKPLRIDSWTKADDSATPVGNERCTLLTYARPGDSSVLSPVARKLEISKSCAMRGSATLPPVGASIVGDVISDEVMLFDQATVWSNQSITRGLPTQSFRVKGYSGTTPVLDSAMETRTYDPLGRIKTTKDALGNVTTTSYDDGPGLYKVTVTNPLSQSVTTSYSASRMLPTVVVDANLKRTERSYDALGRLAAEWRADRSKALGDPATQKYEYIDGGIQSGSTATYSVVVKYVPRGNTLQYLTSYTMYDSRLRTRQIQEIAATGGRLVSTYRYGNRGLVRTILRDQWYTGIPAPSYLNVPDNSGTMMESAYDGANRIVSESLSYTMPVAINNNTRWTRTTKTSYTGESIAVEPPTGGIGTRIFTDALGRVVERRSYPGPAVSGSEFIKTEFGYNLQDRLSSVTATDGTTTAYTFDLYGRKTRIADPDRGVTLTSYTARDEVSSTTDTAQQVIAYDYDAVGRKTATYSSASRTPASQLAAWAYDSVMKGQLASSTRFVGGNVTSAKKYVRSVVTYDNLYRPIRSRLTIPDTDPFHANGGVPLTLTSGVDYNRDDSISSTTEPAVAGLSSEVAAVGYHASGLPLAVTLSGTTGVVLDTSYNAFGKPTLMTMGVSPTNTNRVQLGYDYDSLMRLTRFTSIETPEGPSRLIDNRYAYNDSDQITSISSPTATTTDYQCFEYGKYQRLTETWTPNSDSSCAPSTRSNPLNKPWAYWTTYAYQPNGQRFSSTVHSGYGSVTADRTTYHRYGGKCMRDGDEVNVGPHVLRLTEEYVGGSSIPTDLDSFCATKSGEMSSGVGPGDTSRTMTWNREGKLATVSQGVSYEHLYDADGNLLIKRPTANGDGTSILFNGATEIRMKKTGTSYVVSGRRFYQFGGQQVAVREYKPTAGVTLTFKASDPHGTVDASWNSSNPIGTRVRRFLDPFGNTRHQVGDWVDDKKFLGMSHDETVGLTHINAREYDPLLGQFISPDPVLETADPQTLNGYSYANNDPVNRADPSGMCMGPPGFCPPGANTSKQPPEKKDPPPAEPTESADQKVDPPEWSKPVLEQNRESTTGDNGVVYIVSDQLTALALNIGQEHAKMSINFAEAELLFGAEQIRRSKRRDMPTHRKGDLAAELAEREKLFAKGAKILGHGVVVVDFTLTYREEKSNEYQTDDKAKLVAGARVAGGTAAGWALAAGLCGTGVGCVVVVGGATAYLVSWGIGQTLSAQPGTNMAPAAPDNPVTGYEYAGNYDVL